MNRRVSIPAPTEIPIALPDAELEGAITLPSTPQGIIVFAHGSGSSRHSPRNQYVAQVLQEAGLGTLLMDLLTREEELIDQRTRHLRFDIDLLSRRLTGVIDWMTRNATTQHIPIGLFGASTGAAAALRTAAARPQLVQAVVSRGGRPDLAGVEALRAVEAPTLLIVGGADTQVIPLNTFALEQMRAPSELAIVPGATHLFEEPGTLAAAAGLARDWFLRHVGDEVLRPPTEVEEFPA
ncbi:MAG: dienelactone hydrolase family protein [Thermomicrobiales bacterium]|nr:dienelactone hydrolase family protein [Thermomicrobiales bacterium]